MFSLDNKTALITGAGSGIGKAIAKVFAKHGARVIIIDRNKTEAEAACSEIQKSGGRAVPMNLDITDQSAVATAFTQLEAIHILVNNAGIAHIGNAGNTSEADFDRVMKVNVNGTYNCIQAALPFLLHSKGVILNMASIAASVGLEDRFAYSSSKGAIKAMTLSVARDYLSAGVRCNSISPARVHTPFVDGFIAKNYPGKEQEIFEKLSKSQPIGRMGTPEEIAQLALYLCSEEAGFITGCDYPIDGGFLNLSS